VSQHRTRKQQGQRLKDMSQITYFNYKTDQWMTFLPSGYNHDYTNCGDCTLKGEDGQCLFKHENCKRPATESEIRHQVRAVKRYIENMDRFKQVMIENEKVWYIFHQQVVGKFKVIHKKTDTELSISVPPQLLAIMDKVPSLEACSNPSDIVGFTYVIREEISLNYAKNFHESYHEVDADFYDTLMFGIHQHMFEDFKKQYINFKKGQYQ